MNRLFFRLSAAATLLALVVIVLGAYVRLSDAGLGCPDWPGCYGQILAPTDSGDIERANALYPEQPVETAKAWKEMTHRYLASILGLLILIMAGLAWRDRHRPGQPFRLPILLLLLVCLQGALGMWTVTMLLKPAIVTLHLLAGMLTAALLCWSALRHGHASRPRGLHSSRAIRVLAAVALVVVFGQIALGGWTSTNYVALHCWDFPYCRGAWLPPTDFAAGFTFWRGTGINYEGGVLSLEAGTAVHLAHRMGAVATLIVVAALGVGLSLHRQQRQAQRFGIALLTLLLLQITLGILNVLLALPVAIAVAHNGGAALLLLALVSLNFKLNALNPDQSAPSIATDNIQLEGTTP